MQNGKFKTSMTPNTQTQQCVFSVAWFYTELVGRVGCALNVAGDRVERVCVCVMQECSASVSASGRHPSLSVVNRNSRGGYMRVCSSPLLSTYLSLSSLAHHQSYQRKPPSLKTPTPPLHALSLSLPTSPSASILSLLLPSRPELELEDDAFVCTKSKLLVELRRLANSWKLSRLALVLTLRRRCWSRMCAWCCWGRGAWL